MQPDLKLTYNSQDPSPDGAFGYGWSATIPYIQRSNKTGTDKLYTDNYFTSSLSGDLVLVSGSTYAPRVENGDFLKYTLSGNTWTVADKKGTVYTFGSQSSTRLDNPSDSSKVFKWMLEKVQDTNGNFISYAYFKDSGQIYPASIVYTSNGSSVGIFEVDFLRQSRSDAIASYAQAFLVTTNYRINEVDVKTSGTITRKYVLGYNAGENAVRSMLHTVTESGTDLATNTTVTLPAVTFTHKTNSTTGWTNNSNWNLPETINYDGSALFADVNGDGLPDLLISYTKADGTNYEKTYLNNGDGTWTLSSAYQPPAPFMTYQGSGGGYYYTAQDINGDGLADLIAAPVSCNGLSSCSTDSKIYLNNGHGWTLASYSLPTPLSYLGNPLTVIADFNGDGLPDFYTSSFNINGVYQIGGVYLNNGDGTWTNATANWTFPYPSNDGNTNYVDVNGDGISDIVHIAYNSQTQATSQNLYLGTGQGQFVSSTETFPGLSLSFFGQSGGDPGIRFADINGDGLMDMVQSVNWYGTLYSTAYINTGTGFVQSTSWAPTVGLTNQYGTTASLIDINGDGLADIVGNPGSGILLNNGSKTDVLSTLAYSQGGTASITYKPSTAYRDSSNHLLNPSLPLVVQTVSQVTFGDGGGGSTVPTTYSYQGGSYYYNPSAPTDRKFAGFASITKTDGAGTTTKTFFHQGNSGSSGQGEYNDDFWKIGKVYRVEVSQASGTLFSKTINKWDDTDLGSTNRFVKLVQSVTSAYDGQSTHKDSAEGYTYDNTTGNLTQKTEYGQVTGNDDGTFTDTGTDLFTTNYSYAAAGSVVGLPDDVTRLDQSSNKVSESKYFYDNQALGNVSLGNLTEQDDWITGTTYAVSKTTYDGTYGLVTQVKDADNDPTNYSYDTNNLYPATVTNAASQQTQYAYDYASGQVTEETNQNGFVFTAAYDGLGRLTLLQQPDLVTPTTLVNKATYVYTDTSGAVSVHESNYMDASNTIDTYSYYDGLNRTVQQRSSAEDSGNFNVKDTIYNNLGLVGQESLPYVSSGPAKTAATTTSALLISYTYDPLLRVSATTNTLGSTTNAYTPWSVTVTDANNNSKDLFKDAYGNLVQVNEHNNGSTYTTTYTYDGLKNLTNITDALGNVRNFSYDGLSRRLTAQDLHPSSSSTFGSWSYVYDNQGNLTSRTDPKGATTTWTYDALNRMLTESSSAAVPWYSTGGTWTNRKQLTINHSKVSGSQSLSNFPVLVSVTDPTLKSTANGGAVGKSDGTDILFTASDGVTKLSHELEKYDPVAGTLSAWVKLPSLSPTTDTNLIIYYGNASSGNQQDKVHVWDANYAMVQHLPNGTTLSASDSTSNSNNGSITGATATSGQIGGGANFSGSTSSYIQVPNSSSLRLGSKFTVSAWVYNTQSSFPSYSALVVKGPASWQGLNYMLQTISGTLQVQLTYAHASNSNDYINSNGSLAQNGWTYVVGEVDTTAGSRKIFLNGTSDASNTTSSEAITTTTAPLWIGKRYDNGFNGKIDEVRISNIARSSDWIATEYNNQSNPATFEALGHVPNGPTTNTYDTCTNGIGYLCKVVTDSVTTTNTYNALGLLASETKKINSSNYATSYSYDRAGHQLTISNPDNSQVQYTYNLAGLPETVKRKETTDSTWQGVVDNFDYAPTGNASSQTDTNGTVTTNTYDPTKLYRLTHKVTAALGSNVQDISYVYDAVGNITAITDNSSKDTKKNIVYGYDNLNRLTSYTVTGAVNGNNHSETYTYDAIGNISNKSDQGNFAYGGTGYPNPDALTATPSTNYSYDNNGNLISTTGSLSWYSVGGTWTNRKQLTINHGKVSGSQPLINFPMLVSVTDPSLKSVANGGNVGKSDGTDILFTASDGVTKLSHEIEKYDPVAGTLVAWVKIPSLSPAVDTTAVIYYGNPSASDQQDKTNVWDSHYKAVYHLPNGTTLSGSDSSANGNNGSVNSASATTGQIGGAAGFSGSTNSYIQASDSASLELPSKLTVSAWVYNTQSSFPNYSALVAKGPADWQGLNYMLQTVSGSLQVQLTYAHASNSNDYINSNGSLSANGWTYVVGEVDTTAGTRAIFLNGNTDFSSTTSNETISTTTDPLWIGKRFDNGYSGAIDEVRISDAARSPDWIATEYNNQSNPATFETLGNVSGSVTNNYIYDYNNRLVQSVVNGVTENYTYDQNEERLTYAKGTSTTTYPSKYYNTDGSTPTKHIFANGQVVATVTGTGSAAQAFSVNTDHLTGSNIVTDSTGNTKEVLDYYPYGSARLDQQSGFNEQRKFAGHEFDADTALSYQDARYYDPSTGRFTSEDPAFLAVKFNLSDPQSLNAYAYSRNNPVRYIDPTGGSFLSTIGDFALNLTVPSQQQQIEIGNAANYLHDNNAVWRGALDHPIAAGAAIGVGSAAAAYGGAAALTGIGSQITAGAVVRAGAGAAINVANTYLESKVDGKGASATEYAFAAGSGAFGGVLKGPWSIQAAYAGATNLLGQTVFSNKSKIDFGSVGISTLSEALLSRFTGGNLFLNTSEAQKFILQQALSFVVETPAQVIDAGVRSNHATGK